MVNGMSRSLVKGRADENFLKPHTKLYLEVAPPCITWLRDEPLGDDIELEDRNIRFQFEVFA